jgi:hypothetical protein
MEYFNKWPEAYSLPNQEASTVAEALVTKLCCRFGIQWELHSDQGRNFESRLLHKIHIHKLSMLENHRDQVGSGPASGSKKFPVNLSKYVLTDHEESVLRKSLNFTIVNFLFDLDISCAVESVIPKLPPIFVIEFKWNVRYRLQKSKSPTSTISKKELKALKSLRLKRVFRIVPADKKQL